MLGAFYCSIAYLDYEINPDIEQKQFSLNWLKQFSLNWVLYSLYVEFHMTAYDFQVYSFIYSGVFQDLHREPLQIPEATSAPERDD